MFPEFRARSRRNRPTSSRSPRCWPERRSYPGQSNTRITGLHGREALLGLGLVLGILVLAGVRVSLNWMVLMKYHFDKMASWQNDRLTKLQVDEMPFWQNDKLTKWQVNQVASWQNGKLTEWQFDDIANCTKLQVDDMASWQNDNLMKCQLYKMASWQNGKWTKWQVDKVARWQNGKVMKWHVEEMASWQDVKLMKRHGTVYPSSFIFLPAKGSSSFSLKPFGRLTFGRQTFGQQAFGRLKVWSTRQWPCHFGQLTKNYILILDVIQMLFGQMSFSQMFSCQIMISISLVGNCTDTKTSSKGRIHNTSFSQ